MAFEKLLAFTKDVSDLPDKPTLTPSELKAQFDAAPDEVRVYQNKTIDALVKTAAGDSGAKNIGATAITGLTGSDVQTLLESLKSSFDTLNVNPYFRLNMNSSQSYNTANTDQQITFNSGHVPISSGVTVGTNAITINVAGVYRLNAAMQLSGLNSNILATTKFFVNIGGTTTGYFKTIRGATGWDGANGGGVWVVHEEIVALPVGATITFFGNVAEAPRTIMQLVANAFKISK